MTYTRAVQGCGLGALIASGDAPQCRGEAIEQYSDGSYGSDCCSDTTWTEAFYRARKGDSSTQHYLEQRIHDAMWMLEPNELRTFAYDAGFDQDVSVPSMLLARIAKAKQNWFDLFPMDRWFKNERGSRTDCESDGYYSTWEDRGHPRPDVQAAAVARVLGANPTVQQLSDFVERARLVVWAVPRSAWSAYAQSPLSSMDLVRVEAGQLKPTAWLQSFIDVFAPAAKMKIAASMAMIALKKPTAAEVAAQRQREAQMRQRSAQAALLAEQKSSHSTQLMVLGAAIVLSAGILWYSFARL